MKLARLDSPLSYCARAMAAKEQAYKTTRVQVEGTLVEYLLCTDQQKGRLFTQ